MSIDMENAEKMLGTEGGMGYLVIARRNGIRLGLKIWGSHSDLWRGVMCFRIRAEHDDSNVHGKQCAFAYPNLPWTKASTAHASFMAAAKFSVHGHDDTASVIADWSGVPVLHQYPLRLLDSCASSERIYTPLEVTDYILESLTKIVDAHFKRYADDYEQFKSPVSGFDLDATLGKMAADANAGYLSDIVKEAGDEKAKASENQAHVSDSPPADSKVPPEGNAQASSGNATGITGGSPTPDAPGSEQYDPPPH